ncbi:MAG: integrase arm-type DNA-binding domain-containing protein [Rhodospirillales bacterium]|nr:integrase arm-type DNA-binding domain-containing protein [Rhodospirillales bacterium]
MPREITRKVLTDAMIHKLKPAPAGKRNEFWDAVVPGFGLRVTDAGGKSFFLRSRIGSEQLRMSWHYPATSLEKARATAKAALQDIEKGIDPRLSLLAERQENQDRSRNTFKAVGERFMKQYAEPRLADNTQREYRRVLFGPDTEAWAKRPITSITRADVRFILDAMVERGSTSAANNALAYLKKFFGWCAEKDILEVPPTDRMKAPSPKAIGERTLSESEIVEVWQAFNAAGGPFRDLFKLLLLTGQRRSEVGGMKGAEFSGLESDNPTWEIPSNRTKNGRPHLVPLSLQALAIIKERPVIGQEGYLFTTTGKTALSGFSKAKERIDAWLADKRKRANSAPMPEWTLHDLRRTMVTMMNEKLGVPPHIVEACVNHISGSAKAGVAGVYNKAVYMKERREAYNAWEKYLQRLAGEKTAEL